MKIKDLLDVDFDINVLGLTDDSRNVKKGFIFFATKGFNVDHFDFIDDAIKNGAIFIVCDREFNCKIPYLVVNDVKTVFIECCKKFYNINLSDYKFIGITGTDGKTTTASIVYKLLNACSYIGTNGVYINNAIFDTNNTTPCISELYYYLNLIKKEKCKSISMEVSSEALLHERIKNIKFDIIAFTNITGDHFNIHENIEKYRECKFTLVNYLEENGIVFVNGDDSNCKLLKCQNMYTYGFNNDNYYVICNVKNMSNFVKFDIVEKNNKYTIISPFRGIYNIYNVALAFLICLSFGIDCNYLIDKIKKLDYIPGRSEYLDFGQKYDIILDYAHTYNGIKNILESVFNYKKIIVVTGCAGGRDKSKRSMIGDLIMEKASVAIFTMDDPRFEDVNDIIDDMVSNNNCDYYRIVDRKLAIKKAIDLADDSSVVLILGKGRDKYMVIGDEKIPYSDYDTLVELFKS